MVPFHMLRMVSYYYAIVTLSIRCTVFLEIRLQKYRDLETGLGSVKVIENVTI